MKIASSRRVLTTVMDDGQGLLFASAPSTSKRTWVQQGFPVMLATDVCTQIHLDITTVHCRLECPVKALDPLRIVTNLIFASVIHQDLGWGLEAVLVKL